MRPVQVRVSNNCFWRWCTPTGSVICRVSVTYKNDVVTPDERAMER